MTLRRAVEIRLIRNSGLNELKAYLFGGEVFSFNGGLAAIAGLLLYIPLRTTRWSNRPCCGLRAVLHGLLLLGVGEP